MKKQEGSCREVDNVYKTIEMLYTVVQYANVAFFSGDLPLAYKVLQNSLRLFTRLENTKAIAVACNNIGNTMLTVYRTMKANKEDEWNGMSKEMVIEKGMVCFAKSIKLGEEAYGKMIMTFNETSDVVVSILFMLLQTSFTTSKGGQRSVLSLCSILRTDTSIEQYFY